MMLGPVQRALLAAGDAACRRSAGRARAARASRRRVSAKCALPPSTTMSPSLEQRDELVDHRVGRAARLDHDHDPRAAAPATRRSPAVDSRRHERRPRAPYSSTRASVSASRAVVHGDDVAVPGEVAGQVAAHHREAGDADLGVGRTHRISRSLKLCAGTQSGPPRNGHDQRARPADRKSVRGRAPDRLRDRLGSAV